MTAGGAFKVGPSQLEIIKKSIPILYAKSQMFITHIIICRLGAGSRAAKLAYGLASTHKFNRFNLSKLWRIPSRKLSSK